MGKDPIETVVFVAERFTFGFTDKMFRIGIRLINTPLFFKTCCWQASELRAYIKAKGAEISEENSEGGLHVDLAQIIEACDVCLKDDDKGEWHQENANL